MRVEVMNKLAPHQVELIRMVLSLGHGGRLLLFGPPGVGKTTAITAAASEFIRRRVARAHVLMIASRPLAQHLVSVLRELIGEDVMFISAPEYRRLQAVTTSGKNPWTVTPIVVTSLDFTKADERLSELLEVRWDAVFIEEGEMGVADTFRTRLIKTLWASPGVGIAVATSDVDSSPLIDNTPTLKIVRWTASSLGLEHSSRRKIELVEYGLTDPEREFAKQCLETLDNANKQGPHVEFSASVLRARLASSLLSAEQTLRRYDNAPRGQGIDSSEITTALQGIGLQNEAVSLLTSEDCQRLLELYEKIETDSKWEACGKLLRSLLDERGDSSVVIFTPFVSTSHYIASLAGEFNVPLYIIRGDQEADVIIKNLESAASHPGFIITTDAPLQGLDLSFTNRVVHYDLPRNSKILTLRFSRFIRQHATGHVGHYFLLDRLTATKEDLMKLVEDALEIENS